MEPRLNEKLFRNFLEISNRPILALEFGRRLAQLKRCIQLTAILGDHPPFNSWTARTFRQLHQIAAHIGDSERLIDLIRASLDDWTGVQSSEWFAESHGDLRNRTAESPPLSEMEDALCDFLREINTYADDLFDRFCTCHHETTMLLDLVKLGREIENGYLSRSILTLFSQFHRTRCAENHDSARIVPGSITSIPSGSWLTAVESLWNKYEILEAFPYSSQSEPISATESRRMSFRLAGIARSKLKLFGKTNVLWPPDTNWHFRAGEAAYMGRRFKAPGLMGKLLKMLVKDGSVTHTEIRNLWDKADNYQVEAVSIRSLISRLRKTLCREFSIPENKDPIQAVDKYSGNTVWKFRSELLVESPGIRTED